MVEGIKDYSLSNISNRINLRRGQTSTLSIRFPVFFWLGDASCFHVFPGKGRLSLSAQGKKVMFWGKNTIFPHNTRKIMCRRVILWKDDIFRRSKENIIFPCIFKERSSFIFRPTRKIIFSGKRNIIFPDNTRNIIFHRNFFGKTIFSGHPEKENMVFRAVSHSMSSYLVKLFYLFGFLPNYFLRSFTL